MHPTALEGFRRMLLSTDSAADLGLAGGTRVLDVGGADVNGTVHKMLGERCTIDVLDIAPGPGVTIVADATDPGTWTALIGFPTAREPYDLVISTETFEHVKDWRVIVQGAAKVLRPGGWFIGTCAGYGRRAHGARGEHWPPPGEHYANVGSGLLVRALYDHFDGEIAVEYSSRPDFPTTNDLYWRAQA